MWGLAFAQRGVSYADAEAVAIPRSAGYPGKVDALLENLPSLKL